MSEYKFFKEESALHSHFMHHKSTSKLRLLTSSWNENTALTAFILHVPHIFQYSLSLLCSFLYRFVLLSLLFLCTAFKVGSIVTDFGGTRFYISDSNYFRVMFLFCTVLPEFQILTQEEIADLSLGDGTSRNEMRRSRQNHFTGYLYQCRHWTGQISTLKWCESLEHSIYIFFCSIIFALWAKVIIFSWSSIS